MMAISIAGFDPSGGAGILNDIKTFTSLGVYGTGAVTALTAQNVKRVAGLYPISPDFVAEQIDLVLEDNPITYGKTGMLYSKDIIKTVAQKIDQYNLKLVVDPVMVAGSGGKLSEEGMASSIKKYLLKKAVLVTPNIFEAELLSGIEINTQKDAVEAAHEIGEICDVVVTGGHLNGNNVLYNGEIEIIDGELIDSDNTHGSGCSFSAATVSYLVQGFELEPSIQKANYFVKESIKHGKWGTLDQFWKIK
jgi:hydroxymethylpyrimidine/phosphomethylpyrimidine kinase